MNDVVEALRLAKQFETVQLYNKAVDCYNLAVHFLTLLKRKAPFKQLIIMCDQKILHCVQERSRIIKLNKQIILKKYVLLNQK
ncbi:ac120-like protein [Alphabaculovirus altersperidaniae]|uniref:Ac120-like protein n=1 Tax=Spodoptera eridania nucleopolyhedrovirus TaxID=2315721 RepID=A0ABX6TPY9_9ABAC|nr:ac120-like protein [Spodoptera eridania nucleopolyhedrovirus]QNV47791.1 ac120-like protein [Spodoptera eridania nucleopolyhedrovirus]